MNYLLTDRDGVRGNKMVREREETRSKLRISLSVSVTLTQTCLSSFSFTHSSPSTATSLANICQSDSALKATAVIVKKASPNPPTSMYRHFPFSPLT